MCLVDEKTLDGLDERLVVRAYEKARPSEKVLQTALRGVRARIVLSWALADQLERILNEFVGLR